MIPNDIKFVSLPISLGGIIEMEMEDFYFIISENMDFGCKYRFIVTHNGNPLTKDGIPFESIICVLPGGKRLFNRQTLGSRKVKLTNEFRNYLIKGLINRTGNNVVSSDIDDAFKSVGESLHNRLGLLDLQWEIEEMVRKSDLIKEIYASRNLDPCDRSVPLSEFEELDLDLSLAYFKCSV